MKIPRTDLADAIGQRTLKERNFKQLAREIAAYLIRENREHELESLIRDVLAYRQDRGIVEATVISAHELTADVDRQIKHLLKEHYPNAKHIVVRQTRDTDVIGGLKVQLAHEQLDMSVRAQLDTFKRLTSEGNI